jgi:hypothetical protein
MQRYVVDYEPHANLTAQHAQLLTSWLKSLAAALHTAQKHLAVCVSDWGIIGTVCLFRQKLTLKDAVEFHSVAPVEALACV